MEVIKKSILQVLTTGITATTTGNKYVIVPDLNAVYHIKIGLVSVVKDIGFFDSSNVTHYGYGYGYGYGYDGEIYGIGESLLMDDNFI